MKFSVDDVAACLHRLFIGEAKATLREEDKKKAREVCALLDEIARVTTKQEGVFVDACAGKSALGLIAAELVIPRAWQIVVVERDPDRAEHARNAAQKIDRAVRVAEGDVASFSFPPNSDVVVALHACGSASDAVIEQAASARAKHLLLVPCCYGAHPHKGKDSDIPGQQAAGSFVDVLPRQGLVGRRFAQAVIDAERTLRLEEHGYAVDVVDFVSPSITPHNLLWRCRKIDEPVRKAEASARRTRLRARR